MDLPNEVLDLILSNLNTKDLLMLRLVSVQLNNISLHCLKKRQIQVTIKSDEELIEFSKLFPNCTNIFNEDVNFIFILRPISIDILKDCVTKLSTNILRCTLNILTKLHDPENTDLIVSIEEKINTFLKQAKNLRNLKIIANQRSRCKISSEKLQLEEVYLNIRYVDDPDGPVDFYREFKYNYKVSIILTSLLDVSPNLTTLILKDKNCLIPPLPRLKKLSIQTAVSGMNYYHQLEEDEEDYEYGGLPYVARSRDFDKATINNWMANAPSLETFEHDCHFEMDANEYFCSVQHIPLVVPHLRFTRSLLNVTNISGRIVSMELKFNYRLRIIKRDVKNITKFLSTQTDSLKKLTLFYRSSVELEIPLLNNLETLQFVYQQDIDYAKVLPFVPEIFPKLKFVTFLNKLKKDIPFTRVYPTVKTLKHKCFNGRNWQRVFPNLTSFKTRCEKYEEYEYFLDVLPKVKSLELCLDFPASLYRPRNIWNMITGNTRIESGNTLYIENVNDKQSNDQILPILPSLTVLKVKYANLVHVAAITCITLYNNFKTSQKLKFYITEDNYQTIPKDYIEILKKHHNVIFSFINPYSIPKDIIIHLR